MSAFMQPYDPNAPPATVIVGAQQPMMQQPVMQQPVMQQPMMQQPMMQQPMMMGGGVIVGQQKEFMVALLLSIFVGSIGIDRFYLGYTGLGILKLLTFGGCGLWWLIDLILLATGSMTDVNGIPLKK